MQKVVIVDPDTDDKIDPRELLDGSDAKVAFITRDHDGDGNDEEVLPVDAVLRDQDGNLLDHVDRDHDGDGSNEVVLLVDSALRDSAGNVIDPREETSDHRTGSAVELDSGSGGGDVTEDLTVPGRPELLVVVVQNATGNFSVTVDFDNTQVSLQSGASTDLDTTRRPASNGTVTVTISDDSGSSNTVDYDILLV